MCDVSGGFTGATGPAVGTACVGAAGAACVVCAWGMYGRKTDCSCWSSATGATGWLGATGATDGTGVAAGATCAGAGGRLVAAVGDMFDEVATAASKSSDGKADGSLRS